jgi:hypothetical protein
MKKIILLSCLLWCVCPQFTFAQNTNPDIQNLLLGKRWGLRYFIEQTNNLYDTLIRVHDCQNEFIEITANGRFLSTDLRKEGRWSLNGDLLKLRKSSGGKYKNVRIKYLTKDSLVLVDDEVVTDVFIETYKLCDLTDTTFIDTREIKEVRKSWGMTVGGQTFRGTFVELGLANAKFEWNKVFYAAHAAIEAAPWQNNYGIAANVWSEDIALYGMGIVSYTDFKDAIVGFRPMLGLSANRLLNQTWTAHIAYSYTFFLGLKKFDNINQHAITLRAYIPFSNSVKKVRRIIKQGVDY